MTSPVRSIRRLATAMTLVVLSALSTPFTIASANSDFFAVVNIDRIGHERLDALKTLPGLEWWVEIDAQMFVRGDSSLARSLRGGYSFRALSVDPRDGEIYFATRFNPREIEGEGARVLAGSDGVFVVQANALQAARLRPAGSSECRGHATFVPFVPDTPLAHQFANDAASSSKVDFDGSIQGLVDAIDGNRWFADIQTLATYNRWTRGTDILNARDWLAQQFQALPGLTVETQSFPVGANTGWNVIATLPGTTRPNDWYIIGGHYDAISNNDGNATAHGAEDDGSGTAGVLELARIFTANRPDATMKFICYAGEEQGLFGSEDHASRVVSAGDASKVKGMFQMDMIGYTGDTDLDCRLETQSFAQSLMTALSQAAAQYTTLRIVTSTNPCCSDHEPYLDRGMPAVLSVENDYSTYPGYHRSNDLPSNITIDMGVQILRMNVATIGQLAGSVLAGTGSDTLGVFVPSTSTFFLKNTNAPGAADSAYQFGPAGSGWTPLTGDWNGDGIDTVGLYNSATSTFFLKNMHGPGAADLVVGFGPAGSGWIPVVGDWDGNGTDTVGLFEPVGRTFFLRNSNTPGVADLTVGFGPTGVVPIVGDWDGNGTTTVGVYEPVAGAWFLRNSNTPGNADLTFTYGPSNSTMTALSGDWNNDRAQTAAIFNPTSAAWFLRNANSSGVASLVVGYGPSNARAVRGDWDGATAKQGAL